MLSSSRTDAAQEARSVIVVLGGLVLWALLYSQLEPFSRGLVAVLGIPDGTRLHDAVAFFAYDTPKVLLLLALVVFAMGVVRSFFSPEHTRRLLAGRREGVGNVLAASLGIVTPFCSCSAVPLFIGFVSAGVPLGVTFSFLIAAPMVNEVALGLLLGLVGWRVALAYLAFGLGVAIVAGWVIGRLRLEHWLEAWVREVRTAPADLQAEQSHGSSSGSMPGWTRSTTSSAGYGTGSFSGSPWALRSMVMCRPICSPRSWATAPGGRCRPSC